MLSFRQFKKKASKALLKYNLILKKDIKFDCDKYHEYPSLSFVYKDQAYSLIYCRRDDEWCVHTCEVDKAGEKHIYTYSISEDVDETLIDFLYEDTRTLGRIYKAHTEQQRLIDIQRKAEIEKQLKAQKKVRKITESFIKNVDHSMRQAAKKGAYALEFSRFTGKQKHLDINFVSSYYKQKGIKVDPFYQILNCNDIYARPTLISLTLTWGDKK